MVAFPLARFAGFRLVCPRLLRLASSGEVRDDVGVDFAGGIDIELEGLFEVVTKPALELRGKAASGWFLKSDLACACSLSSPATFGAGAAVFGACPSTRTRLLVGFWADVAGLEVGCLFTATGVAWRVWPRVIVPRAATRKKAAIPGLFMDVVTLSGLFWR